MIVNAFAQLILSTMDPEECIFSFEQELLPKMTTLLQNIHSDVVNFTKQCDNASSPDSYAKCINTAENRLRKESQLLSYRVTFSKMHLKRCLQSSATTDAQEKCKSQALAVADKAITDYTKLLMGHK